jgi:ubiquinone/menaquinone biosynthesis C-methylase UbiE
MNWKIFWDEHAAHPDSMKQVGRIGGSVSQSDKVLKELIEHIKLLGDIQPHHNVLDVCCGNGMVTSGLSAYCNSITGIDLSDKLIAEAHKQHPHISFDTADVINDNLYDKLNQQQFDRITLCFSFQYFETPQAGLKVIENLKKVLASGGKIILTDVPDSRYFLVYYNTLKKLAQLAWKMARNQNDMGKFWSVSELNWIAQQTGLKGIHVKQPTHLPYAHYRMDYVFEKA